MSRQVAGSRKKVARFRRQLSVQYLLLAVVVAGYLAFQAWSEHQLDAYRQQRIEFEGRIDVARAELAAANFEFTRQSEQDRIVSRARVELGFVDSRVGGGMRLAMPAAMQSPDEPWLWSLASGLDRFSGIRAALAAEDDQ